MLLIERLVMVMNELNLVRKSESLINARYFMPIGAQKLLCLCATKMDKKNIDKDGLWVDVNADEIIEVTGHANRFNALKGSAKELHNSIYAIKKEKDRYIEYSFVNSVDYVKYESRIRIHFQVAVIPLMVDINDKFIQYQLNIVKTFKSKYTLRIFELLIQHIEPDTYYYEVPLTFDFLREILMLENKYPRIAEFNRNIINPVIKELTQTEFKKVTNNKIMEGNRQIGVVLIFELKKIKFSDFQKNNI